MSTLLILGDSVPWGQGLAPAHKFTSFALEHIRAQTHDPLVDAHMFAHSGAVIGWNRSQTGDVRPGEVPVDYPTIKQQVNAAAGLSGQTKWIVINGGINDVDIHRMFNPMVPQKRLKDLTEKFCGTDLKLLLKLTAQTFPHAKIFVIGYYPILSDRSDPLKIASLFGAVQGTQFSPLFAPEVFRNVLVENCLNFWRQSLAAMEEATDTANQELGALRCVWVDSGFDVANACYADRPFLWEVDVDPFRLFPAEDEMRHTRAPLCELHVANPLDRFTCERASAGHPNIAGARQIANRLLPLL